jgi:hypothetical protein
MFLRQSHSAANHRLDRLNSRRLPTFLLDSGMLADRLLVPTVPDFDYPRTDLPRNARYVGAVHPAPTRNFQPPTWWPALTGDRPVVHVTQGTIDNADLGRLLEPTIKALADEDVVVVATTGGRDVSQLKVPLPPNTYVAEYLPHDRLLPKVDVMITNGGYGAVQRALSTGVPLVVAGNTEDKPEVAARVAWSGAGIDLYPHAERHPRRGAQGARRRSLPAPGSRAGGRVRPTRRNRRDRGTDRRSDLRAANGGPLMSGHPCADPFGRPSVEPRSRPPNSGSGLLVPSGRSREMVEPWLPNSSSPR